MLGAYHFPGTLVGARNKKMQDNPWSQVQAKNTHSLLETTLITVCRSVRTQNGAGGGVFCARRV